MEFSIRPTNDKLVYILNVNGKDVETVHLPQICIFNTETEKETILTQACLKRLGINQHEQTY